MAVSINQVVSVVNASVVSSLTTGAFDGTGTDRAVVLGVLNAGSQHVAPSGATWDVATPENLTQLITLNGQTYYHNTIFGKLDQASATDTCTATWSMGQDEAVLVAYGLDGVDSFGNTQSGTGTSAEPSETLTSVGSNDLCIDFVIRYPDGNMTAGANQTKQVDVSTSTTYVVGGASSTQSGADGGAMTWTLDGTPAWVHCALNVVGLSSGATASASITEANDTTTGTATVAIDSSAAIGEAADTTTGQAAVANSSSAAITEADDTLAAQSAVAIDSSIAVTEADDSLAASAAVAIDSSSAITEANDTLAATAAGVAVTDSSASISEEADSLSAQALVANDANASIIEVDDSLAATAAAAQPASQRTGGGLNRPLAKKRRAGKTIRQILRELREEERQHPQLDMPLKVLSQPPRPVPFDTWQLRADAASVLLGHIEQHKITRRRKKAMAYALLMME